MHSAGRILVVDDEEVICNTLRIYLESEGFSVHAVHSAREAMAQLEAARAIDPQNRKIQDRIRALRELERDR